QAALVTAMGVPVVNGDLALPVPSRMETPADVMTARSGLPSPLKSAATPQPAPPATVVQMPSSYLPLPSLSSTDMASYVLNTMSVRPLFRRSARPTLVAPFAVGSGETS